ncbi:Helix-turn-helix domain-containing protein [Lentzea albidocapillata subsp. violacea]|uniref:Helix-turn-helix domain-containing protein n=1 Tax=Lentzea albidocapillata subsp. violacea TaxID=128104 RepID=A0A1G9RUN6_9PSEU|nr:helix-turn-helix transcriptional regulator [Lentzea albidocapillata]SDM27008.1 Helix-turn-helix domain-containing protein [Lentzea albidocapillata subsp. violacea]
MPKRYSTVRGREFGDGLRAAIADAGFSGRAAAERVGWQEAKVSDLVNGKGGATETELALLLGVCRTGAAESRHLLDLFPDTNIKGWWQQHGTRAPIRNRTFVEHMAVANKLVSWHTHMVPDALQTVAYMREVLRASSSVPDDEMEARVAARLEMQKQLRHGLKCAFLLHESALRLRVGSVDTQAEQARHLLRMATRANITIRVLPADSGAHAGLSGPFTQLSFATYEPLVWVEGENFSLIIEEKAAVQGYETIVSSLVRTSLDADQSKAAITDLLRTTEAAG